MTAKCHGNILEKFFAGILGRNRENIPNYLKNLWGECLTNFPWKLKKIQLNFPRKFWNFFFEYGEDFS